LRLRLRLHLAVLLSSGSRRAPKILAETDAEASKKAGRSPHASLRRFRRAAQSILAGGSFSSILTLLLSNRISRILDDHGRGGWEFEFPSWWCCCSLLRCYSCATIFFMSCLVGNHPLEYIWVKMSPRHIRESDVMSGVRRTQEP
jgi:hypothetical protein